MLRVLKIDRAFYLVDDENQTYHFLKYNPDWESLSSEENKRNKRQIDGYTRVCRDGRTRTYRYQESAGAR